MSVSSRWFVADWSHTDDQHNTNAVEGSIVGSTILGYMGYKRTFTGPVQELLDDLLTFEDDL